MYTGIEAAKERNKDLLKEKIDEKIEFAKQSYDDKIDRLISRSIDRYIDKLINYVTATTTDYILSKLTYNYAFSTYVLEPNQFLRVNQTIKKMDSKAFNKHKYTGVSNNNKYDSQFLKAERRYVSKLKHMDAYFMVDTHAQEEENRRERCSKIKIYFFGKDAKLAHEQFYEQIKDRAEKKVQGKEQNTVVTYHFYRDEENDMDYYRKSSTAKTPNQLFYDKDICTEVIEYISNWRNAVAIFDNLNITHKTGILLYGAPGTGKTSFAKMIAAHFKYKFITFDMKDFDTTFFKDMFDFLNNDTYVILIEDIDCIFGKREKAITEKEKNNAQALLQFLDGTSSIGNIIYVATTNHIEALDQALIRDGRFDLKIEIEDISRDTAIRMCKGYYIYEDSDIENILGEETFPINPAYLQNKIIQYLFKNLGRIKDIIRIEEKQDAEMPTRGNRALILHEDTEESIEDLQ